jgi:hypothetical protein
MSDPTRDHTPTHKRKPISAKAVNYDYDDRLVRACLCELEEQARQDEAGRTAEVVITGDGTTAREPAATAGDVKPEAKPKRGDAEYEQWVKEGKQIVSQMEAGENLKMKLGELADGVVKVYSEKKLEQFAKAIGKAACTLKRCRSVYRAWCGEEAPKGAAPPESYSVAQELQGHPDRFEIIQQKPNISTRQARGEMRRYKKSQSEAEVAQDGWARKNIKAWSRNIVKDAGLILRDVSFSGSISPEHEQICREEIDPEVWITLREACEAGLKLADHMEKVLRKQPDTEDDFDKPSEPPLTERLPRVRPRPMRAAAAAVGA